MSRRVTAAQLRAAGFTEESIIEHIENERDRYKSVGFSDYQINNFFGIEKSSTISKSLIGDENSNSTGMLQSVNANDQVNTENINVLEKKVTEGQNVDTSQEIVPEKDTVVNPNDEIPVTKANSTESNTEEDYVKPIIDGTNATSYNIDLYKNIKDEAIQQEVEDTAAGIMLSKGKIYFDRLTDQQKQDYSKNGGKLEIDGKPVEVIINAQRLKKQREQEERAKLKVLDETASTGLYTFSVMNDTQINYGLNENEINTLNFNLSVLSGIVSDNTNKRSADDSAGGLFQIRNDEMIGLLNDLNDIMVSYDPDFKRPTWWNKAYGHKKADVLPVDVQRSLALIKLTKNVDAPDLIVAAAQGNVEALETLLLENYDTSLIDNPDKFLKAKEYYGSWSTFDYEYVMAGLSTFKDDGLITETLEKNNIGKKIIEFAGGQGAYSPFGNGLQTSVMGLFLDFQQQKNEYGFTNKEALENSFMFQTKNFGQDVVTMAAQVVGDSPAIAAGATLGFVGGVAGGPATPIIAITGGFAIPETLRDIYMRAMLNDEVDDFQDFMNELINVKTAIAAGKYTVTGAATGTVGVFTRRKYGNMPALGLETATMVSVMSALEGQVPSRKDFLNAAVMIYGIHGVSRGTNKLYNIYKKYGIPPQNLRKAADENPEVLADLLDTDMDAPQMLIDMNEACVSGLCDATNIKIVDPPKNNIGADIKTESSTERYNIVDRQTTEYGETVIKVERNNDPKLKELEEDLRRQEKDLELIENPDSLYLGNRVEGIIKKEIEISKTKKQIEEQRGKSKESDIERIDIPEESSYMAMPKDKLDVEIVGESINIQPRVEKDFQIKQKDGAFNRDIVETRKDDKFLKRNLDEIEGEITNYTTNDYVVSGNETFGTTKYFINKKAYPELFAEMKNYLGGTKKKAGKTDNVINTYFKKLNLSKMSKVDEVFGIRKNGSSGSPYNKIILRTNKGDFVEVPAQMYANIKEYTYTLDNFEVKAKATLAYDKNLLIAYDEVANKVIAVLQAKKVDPKINTQANTYYERYTKRDDKVFPDTNNTNADIGQRKMPDEPESIFKEEDPSYRTAESYERFFNSAKGLEVVDLVALVRALTKNTPQLKNVIRTQKGEALGVFRYASSNKKRTDKQLRIEVVRALQEDPEKFTMTLAHEIGHLIDSLPEGVIKDKDNLLGRLAGLKGYMNEWIGAKADGASPLNKKEIARIKKEAEADAKKLYEKNKKDLEEETGITADDIKGIINDPEFRSKLNPDFYDEFLNLSDALRTQILKSAFKGIIDPYIKPLVDKYSGANVKHTAEIMAKAEEIFARKVEAEMRARGLVNRQEITQELISLSEKWKPYDKQEMLRKDPDFVKYRESSPELMADFMMAILTRPRWTMLNAPKATQLFYNHMYTRPDVRFAYERTQNILQAPKSERYGQFFVDMANMFSDSNQKLLEAKTNAYRESKNVYDTFMIHYVDTAGWFLNRKSGGGKAYGFDNFMRNRWMDEATMAVDAKLKAYQYRPVVLESYITQMGKILTKLEKSGRGDIEQLGTALLLRNLANSTQRSKVANPTGMWAMLERDKDGKAFAAKHKDKLRNPAEAYEILIKDNPLLDELVEEFYKVRKEYVIPLFRESKAFNKKQLEMLENNLEYVNYNVTEQAIKVMQESGGNKTLTAAFMKPTIGTLQDIINPFQSTIEKDLLIIGELKRNALIHDMANWMIQNKKMLEDFGTKEMQKLVPNYKDRIIQKAKTKDEKGTLAPAPLGMETVSFLSGGKYVHYYFNKQAAIAFKRNPEQYVGFMEWISTGNAFLRGIFTQYNPVFWNKEIVKDARATVTNLPKATFFFGKDTAYVPTLIKSLKPAWKSVFGEGDDVTRMFNREGYWLPITDGYRANAGRKHLKYRNEQGELQGDLYYREQIEAKMGMRTREKFYEKVFGPLYDYIGKIAIFYDRANKLGGYTQAKKMIDNGTIPPMTRDELYLRTVSDFGSPPFGLHGQLHPITNNLLLFSNAFTQGWRRDLGVLKGDPVDILGKHMKYQILPKMVEYLAKVGVLGGYLEAVYGGVREYDKLNYHIIPIGFTSTGRSYYLRIPMDETARFFAGLFFTTADAIGGGGEIRDILNVGTETLPSFSPVIQFLSNTYKVMVGGENPVDPYTQTKILDEDVFNSDLHLRKVTDYLKYQFDNNIGGTVGFQFKSDNLEELASELEEILNFPIIGRQIQNYLMVGNDPKEVAAREKVRELTIAEATDRVIYKDALVKLTDPFAMERFTQREIEMLVKNAKYIKSNNVVKRALVRAFGGPDYVEYFLQADKKEQFAILIRFLEPDMSIHGEGASNIFTEIYQQIKDSGGVENVLQNVIE
tara:strand:+ start:8952 stop:15983 length:7032 start_codon:yes stop_codon:yes gene_type:complete